MAKVKLLRDHIDNKAGDTIEVADDQLNYFQSVKLIGDDKAGVSVKSEKQSYNNKLQKGNYKNK